MQAVSPEGLGEHRREESEPCQEELVVRELGLRKCQECWEDRRGLPKCRITKCESREEGRDEQGKNFPITCQVLECERCPAGW